MQTGPAPDSADTRTPGSRAETGHHYNYLFQDVTDKLIHVLNYSFNDSNPDVRFYGKKMILYLSPHQDFDPLCRKYLSADDSAKILGFLSKGGNLNDTLVKPNSARRYYLIKAMAL